MLRKSMPNQVAVRAAGDCGALALPGDDSYEFVFDRNSTPIWFHDRDTHPFPGLTPGVVTHCPCQGPRAPRQSSGLGLASVQGIVAEPRERRRLQCNRHRHLVHGVFPEAGAPEMVIEAVRAPGRGRESDGARG
jgi:hypothetical protein